MTEVEFTFDTQTQADCAVLALSKGYRVEQWYNAAKAAKKPYCVIVCVPNDDVVQVSEAGHDSK